MSESEDGTCKLRRVRSRVPAMVWVVAAVGFWERAAFWGIAAPWQNYMENPRKYTMEDTPGALNLGQSTATRIFCGFFVVYFTSPILFAPLIDSRLGQYRALAVSLAVYVLGCVALAVSSYPSLLDRGSGLPGLLVSMALIALGGGCNKSFGFLRRRLEHTKFSKWLPVACKEEVVVVDPELTLKFIYTLLFWVGNVGALLVFPIVCIERFFGFFPAFILGGGCAAVALLIVVTCKKFFDNVMVPAAKVLACAARNRFKMERTDPSYQLLHHGKAVSWSSQFSNEMTRALGACRVLLAFTIFYICFDQMQNNLISQAGDMNKGKVPNEVVPGMNQVACIVMGPLVEYVLDPALSKRRIYLKPVTRITIGFTFMALSMAYAAIVQHFIYISPPCFDHPSFCKTHHSATEHRPNIWIQTPVFVFMAVGEVFAMTTAMEYAETHAPKEMKVFVQAINMLITGVGSVLAMIIAEAAHDPHLMIFYSGLAGTMALTTIVFYVLFRNRDNGGPKLPPHGLESDVEHGNASDKDVLSAVRAATKDCLRRDLRADTPTAPEGRA